MVWSCIYYGIYTILVFKKNLRNSENKWDAKVRLAGAFLFCYLIRVHNSLPWKTTSLSLFWPECNSSSIRGQSMGPLWFYEAWAGYSLYGTKDKRHIGSTVHATHGGMQCLLRGCTYWNEMWKKPGDYLFLKLSALGSPQHWSGCILWEAPGHKCGVTRQV